MIIDFAANWGADLVVMGSRGYKGLTRLLLGSVAESVVRHAHCSVLVIREPTTKVAS
jgi:nucleotide-binding universal stress UspA family protein